VQILLQRRQYRRHQRLHDRVREDAEREHREGDVVVATSRRYVIDAEKI
jgi:hypothetical protein